MDEHSRLQQQLARAQHLARVNLLLRLRAEATYTRARATALVRQAEERLRDGGRPGS